MPAAAVGVRYRVGQHQGLYQAYRQLKAGEGYMALDKAQKRAVDNALRDFELSGIGLPPEAQKRYGEIVMRLSELAPPSATMCWMRPWAGAS